MAVGLEEKEGAWGVALGNMTWHAMHRRPRHPFYLRAHPTRTCRPAHGPLLTRPSPAPLLPSPPPARPIQFLEGITLASVVLRAGFGAVKGLCMIVTYALTCPVGVAIGIAVADLYNADSRTAITVQGTLNGVSAGFLLYIALIQLVAEDFSRVDTQRAQALPLRLAMYAAILGGAAAMCLLAIWA